MCPCDMSSTLSFWGRGTIWGAWSMLATRRAVLWSPQWTSWSSDCFPGCQRRMCRAKCFRYAQDCSSVCSNVDFLFQKSIYLRNDSRTGRWMTLQDLHWLVSVQTWISLFLAFDEIILDLFPTVPTIIQAWTWTWRQALACSMPSCKKGVAGMTLRISSTWTATFKQSCFTVRLNRIHILRFLFQAQEFMKLLRVYSHHRSNALIWATRQLRLHHA